MRVLSLALMVTLAAMCFATASAEEVESGIEVDGRIGPYRCTKAAGADDGVEVGKSLCYTCKLGSRPVVFVFAKTPDEQIANLAKKINQAVVNNSDSNLSAVINFTGDVTDEYQEKIEKLGKGLDSVAIATTSDGGKFKVNEDAEVTVMHYSGKTVKFNYASSKSLTDDEITKIVEGTKKIVD